MSISLNIIDVIESHAKNMFNNCRGCRGFKHCHLVNFNEEMQILHSVPKKLTETCIGKVVYVGHQQASD